MSILCSLPVIASLFGACVAPPPFATGYVEGEYTLVAPVEAAEIQSLTVRRGDRLQAGEILVRMDRKDAEIALAEAEARLAQAQSQLADLVEGARPEEIEVIEANLATARVQAEEATRVRARIDALAAKGVVTDAQRDDADTAARVAAARVAQIEAELTVIRLPARPQAIARLRADVAAAEAARDRVVWRLDRRNLSLAEPVTIVDIIRQEGEIAGPTAPVLSVLPEGAVKLRLYAPENRLSAIAIGDFLDVNCDGCADGLRAEVIYVSGEPEFTPPMIYSIENRQKLVYLIEARPVAADTLKPGQIVDVYLPEAAE